MNFCSSLPFIEKINKSRDGGKFCPVFPGYGKAFKILTPILHTLQYRVYIAIYIWHKCGALLYSSSIQDLVYDWGGE